VKYSGKYGPLIADVFDYSFGPLIADVLNFEADKIDRVGFIG